MLGRGPGGVKSRFPWHLATGLILREFPIDPLQINQ